MLDREYLRKNVLLCATSVYWSCLIDMWHRDRREEKPATEEDLITHALSPS